MACRVIGSRSARSVAVAGPPAASAARIPRRLGSASAAKTSWATASGSGRSIAGGPAVEVGAELTQLVRPAVGVAAEGRLVLVFAELAEPGLDHGQRGAGAVGHERELD